MAFPTNPSPGDAYTDEYGTVWVYAGAVNGWYRQTVTTPNDTDYRAGEGFVGGDLDVTGDITLDDGGTYATTLQLITPTANRTISFPDATGTVGLVGGSSGQLVYNNVGTYAGAPSTSVGATGNITLSLAGAVSTPPVSLTGTWFSGGTSTTTKPQLLIEPTGTTSTAWSTGGTGLGVNAPSGFGGNLLDLQVNGSSKLYISNNGNIAVPSGSQSAPSLTFTGNTNTGIYSPGADQLALSTNGTGRLFVDSNGGTRIEAVTIPLVASRNAVGSALGGLILRQSDTTNGNGLRISYQSDTTGAGAASNVDFAGIQFSADTHDQATRAGSIRFLTSQGGVGDSQERLRITSAGLVGIGTQTPSEKLEVVGTIKATDINFTGLATYADNAAAITGGLVAGDVYKTATGELRITV